MSADNWRICPKCHAAATARNEERIKAPGLSYGKVTADEYAKLLNNAKCLIEVTETLREDYEIGTDKDGKFYVSYGCSCTECDFKFSFKHEETIPTKPA